MPPYAPKPSELPLRDDDDTVEVDMRWLLADKPGLKAKLESAAAGGYDELSMDYEEPRDSPDLTATEVLDLLSIGMAGERKLGRKF